MVLGCPLINRKESLREISLGQVLISDVKALSVKLS